MVPFFPVCRFIFPALLVICNDVGAYACGCLFGRHPLIVLSPNKTIEGYIGAGIVTLTCGYLNISVQEGLVLATYASLAAPFSGFFASAIKRSANIKDFGSLIPGHGGVTDRMDCQLLMPIFTFVFRQWLRKPEFPNLPAAF
ncbi:phosphatidate cytidylyltransferase [Syncephalastrum racemosum]|uniref:Phosphatidate cytidylyltransferase n=1 Tax=Syncephalastrum racemosum TaxID=13706 RepID=A0A1X2HRR8_SYNRA|nr:phosphatidate cytidylyltransferase [Syncephalastrum racemosum]